MSICLNFSLNNIPQHLHTQRGSCERMGRTDNCRGKNVPEWCGCSAGLPGGCELVQWKKSRMAEDSVASAEAVDSAA